LLELALRQFLSRLFCWIPHMPDTAIYGGESWGLIC